MTLLKNWRRKVLYLLAAGCLFIPAFPDPPLQSGAFVQSVTPRSAVVARIEPVPRALSLVVSRTDGSEVSELPLSEEKRRHAFPVDGLEPGTRYRYVLRDSDGAEVDGGEFGTAPVRDDQAFRFAVVGDSGGQPWWVWLQNNPLFYAVSRYQLLPPRSDPAAVGARMAEAEPDLWLHVGDVIYPRGEHRHYGPGFFRPFAGVLRTAPCYVALGNHDVMQDRGRQCLRNLVMPDNEITGDERFCSFAWGGVRFVVLDLNPFAGEAGGELFGEGAPALEFLDHALADAAEPWRIVTAHYPVYSASRQGDRKDMIEHLLPELRRHSVDLLFVGHDHNFQRFGEPEGGDPVIVVTGGGGKSLYPFVEHAEVVDTEGVFHFCRVDVTGARIEVVGVDRDGREFGAFELDLRERAASREEFDPAGDPRDRRIQALLD